MIRHTLIPLALMTATLAGCGTYAMSAAEYREARSQRASGDRDRFEVPRPYADVAATLQRKAAQCLNYTASIRTRATMRGYEVNGGGTFVHQAKSTVVVRPDHAELSFQVKTTPYPSYPPVPPDGIFLLVADVYPAGKDRTRIEIVRARVGVVAEAIRNWASGQDKGCPDALAVFPDRTLDRANSRVTGQS